MLLLKRNQAALCPGEGKLAPEVPVVVLRLYQPLMAMPLRINLIKGIICHRHIHWFVLKPGPVSEERFFISSRSEIAVFLNQVEAWSLIQMIRDFILLQTLCITF